MSRDYVKEWEFIHGEAMPAAVLERLAAHHAHQAEMYRHRTARGERPEFASDFIRTQTELAAAYAEKAAAEHISDNLIIKLVKLQTEFDDCFDWSKWEDYERISAEIKELEAVMTPAELDAVVFGMIPQFQFDEEELAPIPQFDPA